MNKSHTKNDMALIILLNAFQQLLSYNPDIVNFKVCCPGR